MRHFRPRTAMPAWCSISMKTSTEVTVAGSILVMRFKRPVDIPVDQLSDAVPDYVGSARRDPDGIGDPAWRCRARCTVNSMAAGERLFVDLLPESWNGLPPRLAAGGRA